MRNEKGQFVKGSTPYYKGKKVPEHIKEKMDMSGLTLGHDGEKAWNWKGEQVGYHALHHWVNRKKGKAKICQICGKDNGRLHWANIDHLYRRIVEEYISLYPKCHKRYDMVRRSYG